MASAIGTTKKINEGDRVVTENNDDTTAKLEEAAPIPRRRLLLLSSPIARKIVLYNLLALLILVMGVLYLTPFRQGLEDQRRENLLDQAHLIANVFQAQVPALGPVNLATADGLDPIATLEGLDLPTGTSVYLYSPQAQLIGEANTNAQAPTSNGLYLVDFLDKIWRTFERLISKSGRVNTQDIYTLLPEYVPTVITGENVSQRIPTNETSGSFLVATGITARGQVIGILAIVSSGEAIGESIRAEREKVLRLFIAAVIVSVGLSMGLAHTIATPLSDLARAAEMGRNKPASGTRGARVRFPDLSARPDEIGRLSGALRALVHALYDRLDANEQFAADVAHEIKNPLASLRSAVGTLRLANDEQREKLLGVIDHDVSRLDRLVSDISNASRLDSELVKEDESPIDLLAMLTNLADFHAPQALENGIELNTDFPPDSIQIMGLEGRLAQVFVNLITNAMSFCGDGDTIRIWVRRREDRVLAVVEDTGPGIPDEALGKIFNRFYSHRPVDDFGNHSGLGLAISKQIIEAHGGVIWAENIRNTDAPVGSAPMGARFVVGLPVM
jgi:two-component system sensor histidine kinase ChvG